MLEEKLDKFYKTIESVAGPLCMALTLKKIKYHQLKEFREKLVQAIVQLDEILSLLNK